MTKRSDSERDNVEQTQSIEPKKSGAVVPQAEVVLDEWGAEYSQADVTVPKLLMMQPMGQWVTAGEAAFGELRDSLQKQVYADFTKDLEFIPFYLQRVWVEYEMVEKKEGKSINVEKVYRKTYGIISNPASPEYNDQLKYEEIIEEDGEKKKIMRDRVLNFYVLLADEVPHGIPFVVPFRRTSMRAGKALTTQMFVKNVAAGKTPASAVCKLRVVKQSKGTQTWAALEVSAVRESTKEEVEIAKSWMQRVKGAKVKVDDSAEEFAEVVEATEPDNF